MKLLSFDHRRLTRNLQEAGFDEGQATALIAVMMQYVAHPESADRELSASTLRRAGFSEDQASGLVEVFGMHIVVKD